MPTQSDFTTLFARLRGELEGSLLTSTLDSDRFDILLGAAVAKSIDFNIRVHAAREEDGILFQPFLRPLVEELIYLAYLEMLPRTERDDLVNALQVRDIRRSVRQQQAFFEKHRPHQPILLAEFFQGEPSILEQEANRTLRQTWQRLGWGQGGPKVRDLAERVEMVELYDFLYAATSRVVPERSPHFLHEV